MVRGAVAGDRAEAPELQQELCLVRVEIAEPECGRRAQDMAVIIADDCNAVPEIA